MRVSTPSASSLRTLPEKKRRYWEPAVQGINEMRRLSLAPDVISLELRDDDAPQPVIFNKLKYFQCLMLKPGCVRHRHPPRRPAVVSKWLQMLTAEAPVAGLPLQHEVLRRVSQGPTGPPHDRSSSKTTQYIVAQHLKSIATVAASVMATGAIDDDGCDSFVIT